MRDTIGSFLLIVYGAFCGVMLAPQLGPADNSWVTWAAGIRDVATALGVMIGGAWAYSKYIERREGEPRADIRHVVTPVELESQEILLRVVLEIANTGPVIIESCHGTLDVQVPSAEAKVEVSADPWKSWHTVHRIDFPFKSEKMQIEPGETERYPRDVVVDGTTRVVQLHTRIACYPDRDLPVWDETTIHALQPKSATASPNEEAESDVDT